MARTTKISGPIRGGGVRGGGDLHTYIFDFGFITDSNTYTLHPLADVRFPSCGKQSLLRFPPHELAEQTTTRESTKVTNYVLVSLVYIINLLCILV